MHARDIPIVGEVIDGAMVFAVTTAQVARHPFRFVCAIAFDDPAETKRAFKFLGAGIALAYLILWPAMSRHGFEVSEFRFGVLVLLRLLLVTVIYHALFWVAGYRRPVTTSLIVSSYINGLYFPLFMAAMLPGYLVIGPQYYFDPMGPPLTAEQLAALGHPLVAVAQLALLAAYLFFFALAAHWWAVAFGARVWLSAILLVAAVVVAGVINIQVLPIVTRLFV